MTEPVFLGLDLGTQDINGILVSRPGQVLAQHRLSITIDSPEPGYAEHNPERDWWGNICFLIKLLLMENGVRPESVVGIGIAGLFPVLCALDREGKPVSQAILYSDNRAEGEVEEIKRAYQLDLVGDETAPNLVWLMRNRPADFARIKTVLSSTGYVVKRLTGRAVIDPHSAYRFGGLVDDTRLGWNTDILADLDLPAHIFPEIAVSTEVVGRISSEAAMATGLSAGTPVITGTTDSFAALVGNGVLDPGDSIFNYGTTGFLALVTLPLMQAIKQPACWGSEKPYNLAVYLLGSGAILRWALELLNRLDSSTDDLDHIYRQLDTAAEAVLPGSDGILVLPYWNGRFYPNPDGSARGHIAGLNLQHRAGHLWRALMEAPGYVLATRIEQPLPCPIHRIHASGRGARSETWRKIMTDIVGLPQYYAPRGSGALGIAFLAAFGLGYFDSLTSIQDAWLGDVCVTEPDPDRFAEYRRILPKWQALDELLRN